MTDDLARARELWRIRSDIAGAFTTPEQRLAAAEELAEEISETLARKGWQRGDDHRGTYRFLATGDTEAFREEGTRFLQLPIGDVEYVAVG